MQREPGARERVLLQYVTPSARVLRLEPPLSPFFAHSLILALLREKSTLVSALGAAETDAPYIARGLCPWHESLSHNPSQIRSPLRQRAEDPAAVHSRCRGRHGRRAVRKDGTLLVPQPGTAANEPGSAERLGKLLAPQ